jgi:hypothetical protein
MPYVNRDFGGMIVAAAPVRQPVWAEEFLPDDNEELVKFMSQFSPIPATLPTLEMIENISKEHERIENEKRTLGEFILIFLSTWSNLENTCSRFFYDIVNSAPQESQVAYAIYHTAPGFEGQISILGAALKQLIVENPDLDPLTKEWSKAQAVLRKIKETRNAVAHGSVLPFQHKGQTYVRLTAPWFDVRKNAGALRNHSIPGIDSATLEERITYLVGVNGVIFHFSNALQQYRKYGSRIIPRALAEIQTALRHLSLNGKSSEVVV